MEELQGWKDPQDPFLLLGILPPPHDIVHVDQLPSFQGLGGESSGEEPVVE